MHVNGVCDSGDAASNPYNLFVCATSAWPSHLRMHITLQHSPDSSRRGNKTIMPWGLTTQEGLWKGCSMTPS